MPWERMIRRIGAACATLLAAALFGAPAMAQSQVQAQSRFDGWAAVIVAGDWTGGGQPIMAFDNALRDLTAGFVDAGFSRADMVSRTLRPDIASPTTPQAVVEEIGRLTSRADKGCLLYFTSHGSPDGIVFGPGSMLSPPAMAGLVRNWCGDKPTVIVVSACFSGVFINALQGPNRIVMTAARRDRSSFGCGADSTYPYFDGCVLESLPNAGDFLALASLTRTCVDRRETEEGLRPASEPQLSVGANMQILGPTLRFSRPSP